SPQRLLEAYCRGIFPWYDEDLPICWWSPDPRAIFELDHFHISRRLQRTYRSGRFQVSVDRAFSEVIRGCADRPGQGTRITSVMAGAGDWLHRLGHACSGEVWKEYCLVGVIYGVAVSGLFAGESMFSRCSAASKIALVHLIDRLRERDFQLFDIQFLNAHTA